MIKNQFVHVDISVTDLLKARKFYSKVFDWKINDAPSMTDYLFFDTGNIEGGIGLTHDKPSSGTTIFYVNVENIEAKLQLITELGGKIILERTPLGGNHGYIGRFEDPFGNVIGIWTKD
ncbi:MAG: VOC family protein [Candidatus Heimdallarchaeota archaeon]|nr:VOC family protein [Candidatus Heimdallarchaeota archaeon]